MLRTTAKMLPRHGLVPRGHGMGFLQRDQPTSRHAHQEPPPLRGLDLRAPQKRLRRRHGVQYPHLHRPHHALSDRIRLPSHEGRPVAVRKGKGQKTHL